MEPRHRLLRDLGRAAINKSYSKNRCRIYQPLGASPRFPETTGRERFVTALF